MTGARRHRPRRDPRLALALSLVALAAIALAGCGAPGPTPAAVTAAPVPTAAPSSPSPSLSTTASASPTAAASATPGPASPGPGPVAVEDPTLLVVLPESVAGRPVKLESLAFTDAMADPSFARNVAAAAFGVVVDGQDIASAVVARPADGVWSEAWYRDWRDSYDRGACAQASGLAATAETLVDGRTLYVGTCAGGLHTYHTWLERRGVLVSAFGFGEGRFGDLLMAGLRP